jgi:glycosyltransferase involved in cell wall biosynthesis
VKILQLTESFPPSIGGTQRHVAMQSEELARRGHKVTVATLAFPGAPNDETTESGVRILRIASAWADKVPGAYYDEFHRPHLPTADPGVVRQLRKIVEWTDPDVVIANNWLAYSYLAIKKERRAPLVWVLHDYGTACHKRNLLYTPAADSVLGRMSCPGPALARCIRCGSGQYGRAKSAVMATMLAVSVRSLLPRVDRFIAVSGSVAAAAEPVVGRPIEIIPTFLADGLAELADLTPRPDFLPTGDYVMFVGALGQHKGVGTLIEAHRLLGNHPQLVVIGTRKQDMPLDWGVNVTVATNVPHAQVMSAWKHSLMGLVPSVWNEPWGHVAAEAATVGRPVVASRSGGLVDVVADGVTGLLVTPNDPAALAAGVRRLLDDPAQAEAMGAAGAIRAKQFSASVVTDRFEAVLQDVAWGTVSSV